MEEVRLRILAFKEETAQGEQTRHDALSINEAIRFYKELDALAELEDKVVVFLIVDELNKL